MFRGPASPNSTDGLQEQPAVHPQASAGLGGPRWYVSSGGGKVGLTPSGEPVPFPAAGDVTVLVISGAACPHLPATGPSCLPGSGAVQHPRGVFTCPTPSDGNSASGGCSLRAGIRNLKVVKENFESGMFCEPHTQVLLVPGSRVSFPFPTVASQGDGLSRCFRGSPPHHVSLELSPGRRRQSSLWTPGMRWISWCWSCRKSSKR